MVYGETWKNERNPCYAYALRWDGEGSWAFFSFLAIACLSLSLSVPTLHYLLSDKAIMISALSSGAQVANSLPRMPIVRESRM